MAVSPLDTSYSDVELYWNVKCLLLYTILYPVFSLLWRLTPRRPRPSASGSDSQSLDGTPRWVRHPARQAPMAVLALGPADASTDNLRLALKQLGYKITPTRPDVTASLLARKLACRLPGQLFAPQLPGTPDELRGLFEPVLHRSTAFLGQEAAVLGPELVRAYPEAKVVLNRPRARGGWALVTDDLERAKRWGPWTWELLSCRAFWRGQVARMLYLAHFYGDNEANRTRWYDQHFRHMEVALRGKQYLEWDEAEGWEPLCAFLGLEVPDQPFPAAKRVTPAEARRAWFQKWARYARRTTSTLAISLGIFVAGICVGVKLVLD